MDARAEGSYQGQPPKQASGHTGPCVPRWTRWARLALALTLAATALGLPTPTGQARAGAPGASPTGRVEAFGAAPPGRVEASKAAPPGRVTSQEDPDRLMREGFAALEREGNVGLALARFTLAAASYRLRGDLLGAGTAWYYVGRLREQRGQGNPRTVREAYQNAGRSPSPPRATRGSCRRPCGRSGAWSRTRASMPWRPRTTARRRWWRAARATRPARATPSTASVA